MSAAYVILACALAAFAAGAAETGLDAVSRGADPTGQRDSAGPMQKALDELNRAGGGTLYLPPGRYRLEKPLYVEGGNAIKGAISQETDWPANRPTILCVAFGKGDTNLVQNAAIKLRSGAALRNVAIWHPEQSYDDPEPYPASIWGDGHTSVVDVTLVNSWCGFYNNHCSSMLVRGLKGTALETGIRAAYAFDVPRIEHVAFDTLYWAASGLPGSPTTTAARKVLNTWAERNFIAIVAGEQDWGYWWDVYVNHAKGGIFLTVVPDDKGERMNPGNIAAGKVVMRSVQVGIEMKNVGYPGKGSASAAPLISLEPDSGVGGFTVYYPEQGVTDDPSAEEALRVKRYPPTVRTAPRCQVRNMAIVNAWTAIDAISLRSDGLLVTDVTGGALDAGVVVGHGTTGGLFRDVHFNYTGWVGQGKYANHPRGDDWDKKTTCGMFADFTTRVTRGFVLCDAKDVKFHSCFCIMVAEGVSLEKDPYTGGSFRGSTWGLAFDANTNGIVGHRGASPKFAANCAMGVFSRQEGGYFVKTEPGFAGAIASVNSEIWSGRSRIVHLEGGRTILSQFLSWCCYEGVVKSGAELHVVGSSLASNNGNDKGEKTEFTYERGSSGSVRGTVDGRRFLKVDDRTGGKLAWNNNGVRID